MMLRALGVICSLFAASPASALEVLGPGQDNAALELKKRIQNVLIEPAAVESMRIDKEALKLNVRSKDSSWQLALRSAKGNCPPKDCVLTAQGRLFGLEPVPEAVRDNVVKALQVGPALLTWHQVTSKRPKPSTPSVVAPPALKIDEALASFKAERFDEVTVLTSALIADPSRAPPGALSLHLASGGTAPASVDTMLERFPLEPRVHALAAQKAALDGDRGRAARHLARAMLLTPTDGLAIALAKREGWSPESAAVGPEPTLPDDTPAWPWFLALAILGLMAAESVRQKSYLTLAVLAVAVLGAFLIPVGESTLQKPELVRFQLAANPSTNASESCAYETAGWLHGEFTVLARCSGQNHILHVRAKGDPTKALAQTEHHELTLRGKGSASLRKDITRLVSQIQEREASGFRLAAPAAAERSLLQPQTKSQEWQLRVTFAWILGSLLFLLGALGSAFRELGSAFLRLERRPRRIFAGVLFLFLLFQLLMGGRPIMVFEGYALTEGLAAGDIPRYGAGGLFFYGWTQWFGGTDHVSLMQLNLAVGTLCIVLLLGWIHRLFPDKPGRLVWTAVLVLCLPVIARAHGSESILVAPTAAILGALFFLGDLSRSRYVPAAILLGAAALSRPEMAIVACFIPAFAHVASGQSGRPRFNVPWVALLVLAGIAVFSALNTASEMSARDALPATERGVGPIFAAMTVDGILTDVRCFPVALSLLGLWAFTRSELRPLAFASWALALVWMGLTGVDHTSASTPRTHLPVVFMMVPLLVASWTTLLNDGPRLRSVVVAGLVAAGTLVSGWYLHSHNNDDAEEYLWRALVMDIEDAEACVVAVGDNDPPDRGRTSRHNPEYWVTHAHPGWTVSPLSDVEKVKETCAGKVYALLGVRCYTQIREPGETVPEGRSMHPICADILKEKPARKVIEWDIENRSQMSHPMYPAGSPLRIGVYELAK